MRDLATASPARTLSADCLAARHHDNTMLKLGRLEESASFGWHVRAKMAVLL